ncbi:MAG: hypothetical protein R6T78_02985 [Dehalococcoidales bacterium]
MDEKEFVIERPVKINGTMIITVAEKEVCTSELAGAMLCFAHKAPLYIVVVSASSKKAYCVGGEEISMEQLADIVPGIGTVLE